MSFKDVIYDTENIAYVKGFGSPVAGTNGGCFTAPFSAFWAEEKRRLNPFCYEPIDPTGPQLLKKSSEGIEVWEQYWIDLQNVIAKRIEAYGTPERMIEYLTENGIAAWQAVVEAIKVEYPKPAMPE